MGIVSYKKENLLVVSIIKWLERYERDWFDGIEKEKQYDFLKYLYNNRVFVTRILSASARWDLLVVANRIFATQGIANQSVTKLLKQSIFSDISPTRWEQPEWVFLEKVKNDIDALFQFHIPQLCSDPIFMGYYTSILAQSIRDRSNGEEYESIIAEYYADRELFLNDAFTNPNNHQF